MLPLCFLAALCVTAAANFNTARLPAISTLEQRFTGVVIADDTVRNTISRGSGVIARDTRLVYTCAHVVYDEDNEFQVNHERGPSGLDRWIPPRFVTFYPGHHSASFPSSANGEAADFRHEVERYGEAVRTQGGNSRLAFSRDFVILVSFRPFGNGGVSYYTGGGDGMLKTSNPKFIGGYPGTYAFNGQSSGGYFQHSTPEFATRATTDMGAYMQITGVTAGSGNSGGPVFVRDSAGDGGPALAGILVSGPTKPVSRGGSAFVGVRALDRSAEDLGKKAESMLNTNTPAPPPPTPNPSNIVNFAATGLPRAIPEFVPAKPVGITNSINVTSAGKISSLSVSVNISHTARGDLRVTLVSPSGKQQLLHNRTGGSGDNLVLLNLPLTAFTGETATGAWKLVVQDLDKLDTGSLLSWSLAVGISPSSAPVTASFAAPGLPRDIPEADSTGITSSISVTSAGKVSALSISADIRHPCKGDLRVALISPSGKQHLLLEETGDRGEIDFVLRNFPVTAFTGETAAGQWKLWVQDLYEEDIGSLTSWSLTVTATP